MTYREPVGNAMRSSRGRRLAALAAVIAMLICSAPVASGEPGAGASDTVIPADATTLSLADLGSSETLLFNIAEGTPTVTVSFPAPSGLTPLSFTANVYSPVTLRFSLLTVTQGNRVIARQALPAADAPLAIPLAGSQTYGGRITLTLSVTALPAEDYCWEPESPIRLSNASIAFGGKDIAPSTVAAFLPPVLRRMAIAVPQKPTQAESDAAVQIAAIVARRYGGQNPGIEIVPIDAVPAGSPAPLQRRIEVREGLKPGLAVQGGDRPALLITGSGKELTNQARLLGDDALAVSQSPTAVAGPINWPDPFVPPTATLAQLKAPLADQGNQATVTVDQTRFGHALGDIRIHLLGSHIPLPRDAGGEITVEVGSDLIDRWPTEVTGTIDHWITVPRSLMKRATEVKVSVAAVTSDAATACDRELAADLRISPDTSVQTAVPGGPAPGGFLSFPQVLMPAVNVGLGGDAFGDTVRAVQIVTGLQRSSAVPLMTSVTTVEQAVENPQSAIVISADGWAQRSVGLPFVVDKATVTVQGRDAKDEPRTVTLEPGAGFGSLQAVFDGERSLLVATSNGAPGQLDQLLRWLGEERGRWSGLDGKALISVAGADPITIASPEVPDAVTDATESMGLLSRYGWVWWAAGAFAGLAALGALVILLRIRRAKTP
jgi:hypothetical protein